MKKPRAFLYQDLPGRDEYFYPSDEMDAYLSHLEQRIEKLEAARVEAIDIIRASNNSCRCDVILAEMQENFILKYGGES